IRDLDVHTTPVILVGNPDDMTAVGQRIDRIRHGRGAHPLVLGERAERESPMGAQAREHGELRIAEGVDGAFAAEATGEAEGGKAQVSGGRVEGVIRFSHYLGSLTKFSGRRADEAE